MKKSEEIKKLIDKVVLNEQVRLVKQNLSEEELEENKAYLENPNLYKEIKNAFENNEELKQRIEAQVEKNKLDLDEQLEPPAEAKEDNILMFKALKLMYNKERKKESPEKYKSLCDAIVELDHVIYISEVQNYTEEFCVDKVLGEDEIRNRNKKVFDAINFMRKSGKKLILQDMISNKLAVSLHEVETKLIGVEDFENFEFLYEFLDQISKKNVENKDLNKYKDRVTELKKEYEIKDKKYTNFDKHVIQYSKELQRKNYGKNAASYEGQTTALAVEKQSLFEKVTNKVKSIFNRKPKDYVEPKIVATYEKGKGLKVKATRKDISPKVNIDTTKANELAKEQNSEKDNSIERNEVE